MFCILSRNQMHFHTIFLLKLPNTNVFYRKIKCALHSITKPNAFIPRRHSAKQIPKEVQLFLLMSYFVLGNVYCPPKGLCKADTEGGPLVFTYALFCLRKRIFDFFFTNGFWPFLNLPNVLFGGTDGTGGRSSKVSFKILHTL